MESEIKEFLQIAFAEDVRDGDHSSLACIPSFSDDKAKLLVKQAGVLAGVELAEKIVETLREMGIKAQTISRTSWLDR